MSYLFCYEKSNIRQWDMVEESEWKSFAVNLLLDPTVKNGTIFQVPVSAIIGGIWLDRNSHKSNSVDFYHFTDDYGTTYEKPDITETAKKVADEQDREQEAKYGKYGWISPEGRYFNCNYQGHTNLADRICFGITETNNAELYLEEHGWCKIYKSLFENNYHVYVGPDYVITDAQMKKLIELGLDNAEDISKMLIKRDR